MERTCSLRTQIDHKPVVLYALNEVGDYLDIWGYLKEVNQTTVQTVQTCPPRVKWRYLVSTIASNAGFMFRD
jgi:hypothetical protein